MARHTAGSLIALLLLLFSGSAFADARPDPRPTLRIEAGAPLAAIKRISVSGDGVLLATASEDKTARLWNLATGDLLRTFRVVIGPGNGGKIHAVALSPDGKLLAAGGVDAIAEQTGENYVYVFSTDDGRLMKRLGPMPDVILDLEFSHDGKWLAAGLGHGGVRMWATRDSFSVPMLADAYYSSSVYSISFDKMDHLAAAGFEGKIRVYAPPAENARKLRPAKTVQAPDGRRPVSLDFSPDGKRLALAYIDSVAISILDGGSLRPVREGRVDTGFLSTHGAYAVAWSSDGQTLYAGGSYEADSAIQIMSWDRGGLGEPRIMGGPIDAILDIVSLPEGGVAFSASDAEFGFIGGPGQAGGMRRPVNADFRAKIGASLLIAPDARSVRVGLSYGDGDPWSVSVNDLTIAASPEVPQGWLQPNTEGLPARDWVNSGSPLVNGVRLGLRENETSRSLAVAPDRGSFVMGTDFSLYRFNASGKVLWRNEPPSIVWGVNLSEDGAIIVAALGDGTLRWYRAEDGTELLAMFIHVPDKRWAMWTTSGYYAASPGGEDLIGWQVNASDWDQPPDFFPASRFRERFYRPDIVQLVLATRDERAAAAAADIVAQRQHNDTQIDVTDLPPVITIRAEPEGILTNEPEVEVHYVVRAPSGQKVTRIETRVDGQLVETATRGFSEQAPADDETESLLVPLPRQDCEITLVAFHGQQASAPARVKVKWTGAPSPPVKRKLFALFAGVSAYNDTTLNLNYASKDATDLAAALAEQKGKFFSEVVTTILVDHDVTRMSLEAAIAAIQRQAGSDDYTLVFLAGHGATVQNRFYFLPADSGPTSEHISASGLAGDRLAALLGAMKGKVLLFVDACYSAKALRFDMPGLVNAITGEENAIMMYSSSSGNEVSYEGVEWQNGAFTEALLEILGDPNSYDENGKIITDQLAVALRRKVSALTNGRQTPIGRASDAVPPFPVAER